MVIFLSLNLVNERKTSFLLLLPIIVGFLMQIKNLQHKLSLIKKAAIQFCSYKVHAKSIG